MSKSWAEVKKLLDDPYVSADNKEMLIAAYARENGGPFGLNVEPPEAQQYAERYNLDGDREIAAFVDTDTAAEMAQKESDEKGHHAREEQKQITGNQGELDGKQAPGAGSGAVKNSNELFELAEPALKVFKNFLPVDAKVPGDSRGVEGPLEFDKDIQKRFDEQKGIDFQKFLDDAERLRKAHTTLNELKTTTDSQINSLYQSWSGDAANASYELYSNDIAPNEKDLLEYLEGAPGVIEQAVQTVYQQCKAKADQVLELYSDTLGSATKEIAEKVVKLANGDFNSQDEVLEVAAWVDSVCGSNIESTIRADDCGLNDENKTYVIGECKKWIRQSFNQDLYGSGGAQGIYLRFKQVCDDTKEAVDKAWEELNNYLKEYQNEFPEASADDSPTGPSDSTPQPNPDTGGGGSGGGGTGGGGTGGGTGGGSGTPPSSTTPPATETPSTETPGMNPVTGKPLEVDPETGEPYPIDPETGEAIKDAGDDQDTMTVKKGDDTITMSEPDKDGKMEIKVDDGTGSPKDYQLDWGDGEDAAGAPGTDGATTEDGKATDFGPQGSQDAAQAANGEKVYKPGPDGKIHIEDGNLKITAERPEGPDGPTVVTVDDGSGTPTTYTLGEEAGKDDFSGLDDSNTSGLTPDGIQADDQGDTTGTTPGGSDTGAGDGQIDAEIKPAEAGGFDAPGGLDIDSAGGADPGAAVPAGADSAGSVGGDGASGDPAGVAGATPEQQTAPAGLWGSDGAQGAVGGSLGDTGSLEPGTQAGAAMPQPAHAGAPAGLGSAPGTVDPAGQQAGGMGGMGMMGGMMGGMGGAGGGGGDQERGSSPYRVDGGIFDSSGAGGRISGSLDDEGDRSIRYDR